MQKKNVRWIPCKFGHFWRKFNFWTSKRPFWTPVAPKRDVMWHKVLRPSLLSPDCASFMSRWPLQRGRGSAYPQLWQDPQNYQCQSSCYCGHSMLLWNNWRLCLSARITEWHFLPIVTVTITNLKCNYLIYLHIVSPIMYIYVICMIKIIFWNVSSLESRHKGAPYSNPTKAYLRWMSAAYDRWKQLIFFHRHNREICKNPTQ